MKLIIFFAAVLLPTLCIGVRKCWYCPPTSPGHCPLNDKIILNDCTNVEDSVCFRSEYEEDSSDSSSGKMFSLGCSLARDSAKETCGPESYCTCTTDGCNIPDKSTGSGGQLVSLSLVAFLTPLIVFHLLQ